MVSVFIFSSWEIVNSDIPMFELPEYHQTFGQLGDSVKSVLSHRARATRTFVDQLQRLIARGEWQ